MIHDDGAINNDVLERVTRGPYQLLESSGALSCEFDTTDFADAGELKKLKRRIELRHTAFLEPDTANDFPSGILLVGVQGGGKSQLISTSFHWQETPGVFPAQKSSRP
ncbi:MAG: hypothetical protein KAJ65_07995 [Gammaproteobacteria bacterium]|nr:hypothetical protein [Gammaproteobacteria bacterium]